MKWLLVLLWVGTGWKTIPFETEALGEKGAKERGAAAESGAACLNTAFCAARKTPVAVHLGPPRRLVLVLLLAADFS